MAELKLTLILSLVTAISISVVYGCPDGFIRSGNSCYHFSHDQESWSDALIACEEVFGGHLAEIEDANEDTFLKNEVKQHGYDYWVGGNDLQKEGEWRWSTTNQIMGYTGHWLPGNPNNGGGEENCLELKTPENRHDSTSWNDVRCKDYQHYICEVPLH